MSYLGARNENNRINLLYEARRCGLDEKEVNFLLETNLLNEGIMNKVKTAGKAAALAALGYGAMNTDFKELPNKAAIARNSTEERIRNKVADGIFIDGTPEDYKGLRGRLAQLNELASRTPEFKAVFDKVNKNPSLVTMQRLTNSNIYRAYVYLHGAEVKIAFGKSYGTKAYLKKAQEEYHNYLKILIDEVKKEFKLE